MEALLLLVAIPAVLIIGIIVVYNGIIGAYNAVERGWASVLTQERQKNKIIPTIEKLVEDYKLHESGVLTEVTKLRSALADLKEGQMDANCLAKAEQSTAGLMKGLQVAVEAYPELKASDVYLKLMAEISEQQAQIGAAIRIFNQNVEDFNNKIQMFPGSVVNGMFNKKQKINTFTDQEAESGFDYKPNF
ncbi:LemA family protein [Ferrimonas pelagia]|uniref:LemA family protein n=1 Tax=Ferrimonas pelagia TaxID=1177826 RepID=A0ABP9ETL7_9GAMM